MSLPYCRNATGGKTHKSLLQPYMAWAVALLALANTVNTASRISELQQNTSVNIGALGATHEWI